jgi:hypothetical protein
MSEPKEPRFFEMEYDRGMDFYWNTYFKGWAGEPAVGEASPRNLYLPYVPKRIKAQLPDAKLIVIFRNPIDAAFSAWWMWYSLGAEKLSFEDAIHANVEQLESGFSFAGEEGEGRWREAIVWGETRRTVTHRWYLDMGYYAEQLKRYLALFPRSQIKILFLEDMCENPQGVVTGVWDFIGVDPGFRLADTTPQMVATPRAAFPLLRIAQVTHTQYLIPKRVRTQLAKFFAKHSRKPKMNPSTRAWLVEHYYRHNRELEQIAERDLSHWDR